MAPATSVSGSLGSSTGSNQSQSGVQYQPWQNLGIAQTVPGVQGSLAGVNAGMGNYNALLQQIGGTGPAATGMTGSFGTGAPPPITVGGVYSPQLMQQNVNGIRAQGDATTAGQIAQQDAKLAGAGLGANSPLSAQLATQARMGNQANTQGNVTNFLTTAAGQNAQQRLASEQASGQMALGQGALGVSQQGQNTAAYQAQNNQDIQRRQLAAGQYATLAQQQNALLNNLFNYYKPNPYSTSSGQTASKQASQASSITGGDGGYNPFPGTALDNA